jgi:hypothetical protein
MEDKLFVSPETPSPFNRPDRCPRCDTLATSWVYVGGRMSLCSDCHAELNQTGEPANLRAGALTVPPHRKAQAGERR